jgi:sucrose-6F-phosphate phosphohydrolase
MNYILISDLDDTLIGNDESLQKLNHIISSVRERFFLVYSSGRFKESMFAVIEENGLLQPDAIISNVGTEIYYSPQWQEDNSWEKLIGKDWQKEDIVSLLKKFPVEPQPYHKRFTASYYAEDASVVKEIRKNLKNYKVQVIHTKGRLLDIIPQKAGKGNAARYLKKKKALPTICSGDSENDIDMLTKCDFSILVGNAEERVKNRLSKYDKIYQATSEYASGVLEGLRFFKATN